MNDLFYFSNSSVGIPEIADSARALGYEARLIDTCDGDNLNVSESEEIWLHWIPIEPMGMDFKNFEPEQQKIILASSPKSGFIVSFHFVAAGILIRLLRLVLERYGGWIGDDDNKFEIQFDVHRLSELSARLSRSVS